MTAEQKAKELIGNYSRYVAGESAIKRCAIIAVEEILSVLFQHHKIDYWKQVLHHIKTQ